MQQTMRDLILRFFIGGTVVSLFAILGDLFRPKSLAGLFGAAAADATGTSLGCLALFAFALIVWRAPHLEPPGSSFRSQASHGPPPLFSSGTSAEGSSRSPLSPGSVRRLVKPSFLQAFENKPNISQKSCRLITPGLLDFNQHQEPEILKSVNSSSYPFRINILTHNLFASNTLHR
jgi:hypothetical protein